MKAFYITGEGRNQYLQQHTKPEAVKLDSSSIGAIKACHGLDLPPGIPAGAVAAMVDAARALVDTVAGFGNRCPLPVRVESGKLAAALAPFTGSTAPPVSPPAPDPLPHEVRAAFKEVRKYLPEVCHVCFSRDAGGFEMWEFTDHLGNAPAFPKDVDVDLLNETLDWVCEHHKLPVSFTLIMAQNGRFTWRNI